MKNMHIAFSPPDITEEEIAEVADTLRNGWITTGPKTKLFEKQIAQYCHTSRAVCLNSATACSEMTLRVLGIGPGDEVITSAYTYTASASVILTKWIMRSWKQQLRKRQKQLFRLTWEALSAIMKGFLR